MFAVLSFVVLCRCSLCVVCLCDVVFRIVCLVSCLCSGYFVSVCCYCCFVCCVCMCCFVGVVVCVGAGSLCMLFVLCSSLFCACWYGLFVYVVVFVLCCLYCL